MRLGFAVQQRAASVEQQHRVGEHVEQPLDSAPLEVRTRQQRGSHRRRVCLPERGPTVVGRPRMRYSSCAAPDNARSTARLISCGPISNAIGGAADVVHRLGFDGPHEFEERMERTRLVDQRRADALRHRQALQQIGERLGEHAVEQREHAADEDFTAQLGVTGIARQFLEQQATAHGGEHHRLHVVVLAAGGEQQRQPALQLLVAEQHDRVAERADLDAQAEQRRVDIAQQLVGQRRIPLQRVLEHVDLVTAIDLVDQLHHHRKVRPCACLAAG